jgi:hypothetical protein
MSARRPLPTRNAPRRALPAACAVPRCPERDRISSSENKTLPAGAIIELVEGDVHHWGSLMAAALLGSLPVVILCSFLVEHYVSSLTAP